jgi:hypothetical protein
VVPLASAASRLLQLADIVACSRKWISDLDMDAAGLAERYRIHTSA